jgi:hypothetical protein
LYRNLCFHGFLPKNLNPRGKARGMLLDSRRAALCRLVCYQGQQWLARSLYIELHAGQTTTLEPQGALFNSTFYHVTSHT